MSVPESLFDKTTIEIIRRQAQRLKKKPRLCRKRS